MRKIKTILLWLLLGWGVWIDAGWAILDLEVTSGMRRPTPMAMVPFQGDTAVSQQLVDQIRADLIGSGRFRFVSLPATTVPGERDWHVWRQQGAEALIKGTIQQLSSGRYRVTMKLIGLYGGVSRDHQPDQLAKIVLVTSSSGLLRLGHRMSDVIYEKLTGVPGIFSTKVAYVNVLRRPPNQVTYQLIVANIDGHHPRVLLSSSEPIMSPSWSPDGTRLVYVSFENHRAQVVLQTLKTGQRQILSRSQGINGAPVFSPDGRQVALVRSVNGNPKIYSLDLSTGRLKQITRGWSIDTEPSWSPDGRLLLFTSNRDGAPQIYFYRFSDHVVKRLTYDGRYNARPRWLPNGKGFVFMHQTASGFVLASQGLVDNKIEIFSSVGKNESPSVAPNGQMVVYVMQRGHQSLLAQASLDGRVKITLPVTSGNMISPAWSPWLVPAAS